MPLVDKKLAMALAAARKKPCNFLASPGKEGCALFVSRKPIPAAKAKEARQQSGGSRTYRGRCFLDGGTMVFESADNPPGDLAKKIRAAASEQAGMTLRVEVRPVQQVEEIDEPEDEAEDRPAAESEVAARPEPAAESGSRSPAPPPPPPPRAAGQFQAALAAVKTAMDRLRAADPERVQLVRAQWDEIQARGEAGDFDGGLAAIKGLTAALVPLLRSAEASRDGRGQPVEPARPEAGPTVRLQQSRLIWGTARKAAFAEVAKLQAAILGDPETKADPRYPQIARAVGVLTSSLERALAGFDERLEDVLDDLLNAPDPAARQAPSRRAVALIGEYRALLQGDPLIRQMGRSGYGSFDVFGRLSKALDLLEERLGG